MRGILPGPLSPAALTMSKTAGRGTHRRLGTHAAGAGQPPRPHRRRTRARAMTGTGAGDDRRGYDCRIASRQTVNLFLYVPEVAVQVYRQRGRSKKRACDLKGD